MKNNLQRIKSRIDETKNQITDLEYKEAKNTQSEQEEKGILKKEDSVRSLQNSFMCTNICIMGVPKRKEKEKEFGKIMAENFPNLVKEMDIQV